MLFFEGLQAGLLVKQFKENKDLEYTHGITRTWSIFRVSSFITGY